MGPVSFTRATHASVYVGLGVRTRAELVRSRRNRRGDRWKGERCLPSPPLSLSWPLVERICLSRLTLQLPLKLREPSFALLLVLLSSSLLSSFSSFPFLLPSSSPPTLSFFPQRHALEMNPSRYVPSHFHDRQKFISNRNVNISVLQLDSRKYPVFIKSLFSCFDNFREREREREKWV